MEGVGLLRTGGELIDTLFVFFPLEKIIDFSFRRYIHKSIWTLATYWLKRRRSRLSVKVR